jgi:S1-C subfamily serine protease
MSLRIVGALVGVLIGSVVIAQQPQERRRWLPDDNLAYPVQISRKAGGFGSGFYFNAPGATHLVTAKHVLFDMATGTPLSNELELLSYSRNVSDLTPNVITVDLAVLGAANVMPHRSEDIAVLKLFSTQENRLSPLPGVVIKQAAPLGIVGAAPAVLRKFDQVLVGNDVLLLGFPSSLGLREIAQFDPRSPLLRRGIIAGLNVKRRSIIIDCPAYPGNSGGPVLEVDEEGPFTRRFSIIGVVREFVPYAESARSISLIVNSGYSVVTPIDFALELIK